MFRITSNKTIYAAVALIALMSAFFYFASNSKNKTNKQVADILIINGKVVTMDQQVHVYNSGWVAVLGDSIVGLGEGKPPKNYIARKIIDAKGKVVMPGLINTHSHAAMVLLTGIGENQSLKQWLATMAGYERYMTPEDVYWGTLLAEIKMLRSGTTAFNDMYLFEKNAGEAVKQAGMRAILRLTTGRDNGKITFSKDSFEANKDNQLLSFSLAPNPLLDYSEDELKQISDYALEKNYIIHIHFDEDAEARSDAIAKYKLSPLQLIAQAGLLKNKIVLAHAADLTDEEIKVLANYPNAGISFNPISERRLSSPLTPAEEMLKQNLTVGLGTDGEPSSNLNMFDQMKAAAQSENLKPEQVLRMATIDAAKVLGMDAKIGSLEAGKQADIILLSMKPSGDIYYDLVYNTTEGSVTDSIIAGKQVMENGKLKTLDEKTIVLRAQNIAAGLKDLELTK